MSIYRGMDNEDCYKYPVGHYSVIKRNEIMPFIVTWMELEIIILSEVRERQISYDINYIWTIKKGTNELM